MIPKEPIISITLSDDYQAVGLGSLHQAQVREQIPRPAWFLTGAHILVIPEDAEPSVPGIKVSWESGKAILPLAPP